MNIKYIKEIFDKNKDKKFLLVKKDVESYSKKFTLPITVLFFIFYCLIANSIFNIVELLETRNYIHIILFTTIMYFLTKYTYLLIKSYRRKKYIDYLIKINKELYDIYKEVLFYRYQNNKEENTFLIYLSEFKEISEEDIQKCINKKNNIQKIKNSIDNDEDLDLFK